MKAASVCLNRAVPLAQLLDMGHAGNKVRATQGPRQHKCGQELPLCVRPASGWGELIPLVKEDVAVAGARWCTWPGSIVVDTAAYNWCVCQAL